MLTRQQDQYKGKQTQHGPKQKQASIYKNSNFPTAGNSLSNSQILENSGVVSNGSQ
jgi:hypothetical protein